MLNRIAFRENLVRLFSADEIENLAYDVGMNTSSFSSYSIDVRARELLQYSERLGLKTLELLADLCAKQRSTVNWRGFLSENKATTLPESITPSMNRWQYPSMPQLPFIIPVVQLIGRWHAESHTGNITVFDLFPNGQFEISGEGMLARGRWQYDPTIAILSFAGLINGVTPYTFGVMVTTFNQSLFFSIDGFGIIYRYSRPE